MKFQWVGSRSSWWTLGFVVKIGPVRFEMCPSNFNRPLPHCYDDGEYRSVGIGWGNGNSDDAVSLIIERGDVS